jgi:methylphosphotriester-DNA--protein-cysteine methyltransferase/mannose-6-phosphate isomerase-like protein (cupin superfamily)
LDRCYASLVTSPNALYQPFPMLAGRRAQAWRHQPSFLRPRHFHREPELNLVVRGVARLAVGERVVELAAGAGVFFAPGQDHQLLGASADLELYAVAITEGLAERVARFAAPGEAWQLREHEVAERAAGLRACGELCDAAAVERLVVPLFESSQAWPARSSTRRSLERLLAEPAISGSQLASYTRTSPSELSRHFRRELGVRFVEYRARLRLMAFIRRVDAGSSLTAAALDADFGSYAQCHRVFQRVLGCSPLHYFGTGRRELDDSVLEAP